ncbi:hypothetical protein [Bdellovibrio sp. KM01]|uniref:hypothetical protein n=1 Tax=Bdellovibrio sp. KM01 TaxID=2748865 RepID=UPI001C671884|nr:hypothetical protein [Bdellovibrio sp. KM01]
MLNIERCRRGNLDCRSLNDDQLISPLGVARYGGHSENFGDEDSDWNEINDGGFSSVILSSLKQTGKTPAESCVSLDKVLSKYGGANNSNPEIEKAQYKIWDDLKAKYSKQKKCDACTADTWATAVGKEDLNLPPDDSGKPRSLSAFSQDSYGKALYELLYPKKCSQPENLIEFGKNYAVKEYPQASTKSSYTDLISKVAEVLTAEPKHPIGIDFCSMEKYKVGDKCNELHSVVITGFRRYCVSSVKVSAKGSVVPSKDCPNGEAFDLKIQNSWGASWQKANNDGWIDAKALLDSTGYKEKSLTWIEDVK